MKQLTICVPAYNVEKYIENNLNAYARVKKREDLEVLVIDDGSTDATVNIALKYNEKYPECISVLSKENGGHGSAVNYGIKYATGRYFCIVDGDDWVSPKSLEQLLTVLKKIDRDAVVMNYITVEETTGKKELQKNILGKRSYDEIPLSEINRNGWNIPMASFCIKTELLQSSNYHISEKIFYVDEEYCTVGISKVKSILYLNLNLYCYRIGNVGQSTYVDNQIKYIKHKEAVLKKLIHYYHTVDLEIENCIYVQKKIIGIIKSMYEIMLVENPDKKKGRAYITYLRRCVLEKEIFFNTKTRNTYLAFLIMSNIKSSKQILKLYRKLKSKKG